MRGTRSTRPSAPSAAATAALASSESRVRVTTVWGRTTPAVSGRTGSARVSSSAMSGGSIRDVSADDSTLEPPRLFPTRSEEHTSELQSQFHLVCRLLLEKKKKK